MYYVIVWDTDDKEWTLLGEGPWNTLDSAVDFAHSEVGMPWFVTDQDGKPLDFGDHRGVYKRNLAAPQRIRNWVEREFNPKYHESVTQDLIDVATGNREGNLFEREAIAKIFPEWRKDD